MVEFEPSKVSFGAWKNLSQSSKDKWQSSYDQRIHRRIERLLVRATCLQMGNCFTMEHPWHSTPTFGEIVSEDSTPVGITSQTLEPIIVNRTPANQTDSSASYRTINQCRFGACRNAPFTPTEYSVFDFGWMLLMRMPMAQTDPLPSDGSMVAIYWINQELEMMPLKRQMEATPLYGSGINNNPVIRFDGRNDYLSMK